VHRREKVKLTGLIFAKTRSKKALAEEAEATDEGSGGKKGKKTIEEARTVQTRN
jgi:hypothetical protein